MTYEQACAKLMNHGNLVATESGNEADEESFCAALWTADKNGTAPPLTQLYEDILAALEVVNRFVNGDPPSETMAHAKKELDRSLVNAMWYIAHSGWEYHRRWELEGAFETSFRDDLALTLWRITCAFGAVLDGCTDSLVEHVQNEEWAMQ
jgi:hypothetical protein